MALALWKMETGDGERRETCQSHIISHSCQEKGENKTDQKETKKEKIGGWYVRR
jgi:hypothetical protein